MSVVKNPSIPKSALNKKHNSICYHRVREAQDEGILRVEWIQRYFNLVGLFTKPTIPTNTRHNLVYSIFSNTVSPIGDIEKAYVYFYMGASN